MTTAECIRQRVSCRRFQETPIPREDIRRVVDLARFSPSWKNTQPVRYIVIDASWAYLTPAPPGVCWSWRACAPPASSPWAIPSSGKTVPAARRRRSCCPSDKTIIR